MSTITSTSTGKICGASAFCRTQCQRYFTARLVSVLCSCAVPPPVLHIRYLTTDTSRRRPPFPHVLSFCFGVRLPAQKGFPTGYLSRPPPIFATQRTRDFLYHSSLILKREIMPQTDILSQLWLELKLKKKAIKRKSKKAKKQKNFNSPPHSSQGPPALHVTSYLPYLAHRAHKLPF